MKSMNRTLFVGALATTLIAGGNSVFAQGYHSGSATGTAATDTTKKGNLTSSDARFLRDVAEANQGEIDMAQIAVQKSQNADVKQYAQKLLDDHTAQQKQLQQLAQQKGVTLKEKPEMRENHEIHRLNDASAKNFDKDYLKYMIKDHEKDIKAFQKEADKATDPDVKSFASGAVPTLQQHLNAARQLDSTIAGSSSTVREPAGSEKKY